MTDPTRRRRVFREHLMVPQCLVPASIWDALSARIAEDAGYEIGMMGGSSAALAVLGAPDVMVLTLGEFAEQCRRIARASDLPFMVDADHGYGNALNVMRTVEELETAGVSALTIEDTALPMSYGQDGTTLLSLDEGVGKMRAAVAARRDTELVIVGRTSACGLVGLDEAVVRARAYQECGVDALFLLGVTKAEEIATLAEAVSVPLVLQGPAWQAMDRRTLAAHHVRVCLRGHQPLPAGLKAIEECLRDIRSGTEPGDLEGLPDKADIARWMRQDAYDAWIAEYLGDAK